ncbi:MAG: DUF1646 family protein [Dehalococcoidia bacterium]|nr:DUF1646 family protein [Dehalococcoidia bacterium]
MDNLSLTIGLSLIFLAVLAGPFLNKTIEGNLEAFLFVMGLLSATVSTVWSAELVAEGFKAPISITLAVLAAGLVFHFLRKLIDLGMNALLSRVPLAAVIFTVVMVLGLVSSVISAIIAALILVEFVSVLRLHRKAEVNLTVVACFAIGLGATLTPLGEPLATIAVSKLAGAPYNATFFYLVELLASFIIPAVFVIAIGGMFLVRRIPSDTGATLEAQDRKETLLHVFIRAGKVYIFVMALIFLGAGFSPLVDAYFSKIPYLALFWANMVSAILDNATLTAAEIGPALSQAQIKAALLGLLISGGMLIPGNIPNIISANKLKITSTEWARLGVPLGLLIMAVTWVLLILGVV